MKIVIIHGQNHHGSTYHITEMLTDNLTTSEDQVSEFFLPTDGPKHCIGCYRCFEEGEACCPHKERVQKIVKVMDLSDIIIINSPTYCLSMTGQLKTLFDHLAYQWMSHRPKKEMFSKTGIVISTTAGAGAKKVTKDLSQQLFWLGVPKVYQLPVKVGASSWGGVSNELKEKVEVKIYGVSQSIKRRIGKVKPSLKHKITFELMRMMQRKNDWNFVDRGYWEDKGWLGHERPWK